MFALLASRLACEQMVQRRFGILGVLCNCCSEIFSFVPFLFFFIRLIGQLTINVAWG